MDNIISVSNLDLYYGEKHALHKINMDIRKNSITALIGPSGCGKSTFLKCLNRMIEKGNYESKEAMAETISILFANNQLTQTQYEELMAMLEA